MSSGVEFDEDKIIYRRPAPGGSPSIGGGNPGRPSSGMAAWLIRKGWAKSNNSAQILLVVIVLINIIITYILIKYFL
jgi:hypothetical protein